MKTLPTNLITITKAEYDELTTIKSNHKQMLATLRSHLLSEDINLGVIATAIAINDGENKYSKPPLTAPKLRNNDK